MPRQSKEQISLWNSHLDNLKKELNNFVPIIYKSDHLAVIVEPRNHKDLEIIVKSTMFFLNNCESDTKWGLKIYYGNKNRDFVKEITKKWENVILENLEVDNFTPLEYNSFIKTKKFWNSIPTEDVLMFQTDTILLRYGIDEFLSKNLNYLGAPWHRKRENTFIGNGGLSLRKKSKMLWIIDNYLDNSITQEDIYFCKYLYMNNLLIDDVEIAGKFSVEDVYFDNPLGLHQPKVDIGKLKTLFSNSLNIIKYGK
jgi:hypothetical protein